ncbi:VOC family protein [Streptomyces sp. NPDC059104]|uniref:VOC family protein n=1 Tax=Streptomyces sp. NPDC059104 TaxID=3346729 RepID=UPI0036C307B8
MGRPVTFPACPARASRHPSLMKASNPDGTVPDPMPPTVWTTYLSTDSVDAALKSVTDAGGSVMMGPMDVMDLRRMAVLADPQGGVFAVVTAKAPEQPA